MITVDQHRSSGFRCSRGFCRVSGPCTQRAPSQEPVEQLSKTTIVVESPAGTLERSIFAGIPSVATVGLSAAGFIAESLTEVTSCISSAARWEAEPSRAPHGSSKRGCLEINRGKGDSSGFDCISKVVFRGSLMLGSSVAFGPGVAGFPLEENTMRLTSFNTLIEPPLPACTCRVRPLCSFSIDKGEGQFQGYPRSIGLSITRAHPQGAHSEEIPRPPAEVDSPAGVQWNSFWSPAGIDSPAGV